MERILITLATLEEAQPTIARLRGRPAEPNVWHWDRGTILVTGVGCVNASAATARYLKDVDEVWNAGVAGTLVQRWKFADIVSIRSVAKNVPLPSHIDAHSRAWAETVFPVHIVGGQGEHLLTSDYPVRCGESLNPQAALVDMEGYGVAVAAALAIKPCRIWKIVSDTVGEASSIKDQIPQLAEKLSLYLALHAAP